MVRGNGCKCEEIGLPTIHFGTGHKTPKCTWLDFNHSNGLRFNATILHMPDSQDQPAVVDQYNIIHASLGDSSPRFRMHTQKLPDDIPPFFNPRLNSTKIARGSEGCDGQNASPPSKYLDDVQPSRSCSNNIKPTHVVISDFN